VHVVGSDTGYLVERRGAAAVFRIDRPSAANALSRPVLLGLGSFARAAGADPQVRLLVVTGAGDRFFCAGADLRERAGLTQDQVREQLLLYRSELGALDRCPKAVVAALNGMALGGGLEIALACDLRVAAPHARLALPEVGVGIIPGAGGTQRLPRLVGEGRAKEMILLGRRVEAAEALAIGLVNRIAAEGTDVVDDALGWLEPVLSGAPLAQAAALRAIDAAFGGPLDGGLEVERLAYEQLLPTADRQEGLRAFSEKRKPVFRGR
jgi:enoyl-CoA hydratase/carnithine racemase